MAVVRDWHIKLQNIIDVAKTSDEGSEFFIEMCSNPIKHTWVTSGALKNDGSGTRHVHTRMVDEPSGFPSTPPTKRAILKEGYRRYLNRVVQHHRESGNTSFSAISFEDYVNSFNKVTMAVDTAIRECHAVKCYEDGDMSNQHPTNIFFLHPCDVFNMYVHRISNTVPNLFITTNSLNVLWVEMRNELTDSIMTEDELRFLTQEIDYFYNCFAYYGNFSFVPIRTQVSIDSESFPTASFYTNNTIFRDHQRGKFVQITQDHNRMLTRVCYRID
jgi:hypothetical protein